MEMIKTCIYARVSTKGQEYDRQLVLGILAQFNSMERSLIRSRMESGYWYAGTAIPEGYIYAGNAGVERKIIELQRQANSLI